eukprot:m.53071 g.53071  ORF g.53071 m.53071 type:complete len:68 (+) comp13536_c0_seq11:1615-1818(+)
MCYSISLTPSITCSDITQCMHAIQPVRSLFGQAAGLELEMTAFALILALGTPPCFQPFSVLASTTIP